MKLLYLYVETWPVRCITKGKPIDVNFDSGYKFQYDSKVNTLSCEVGEGLPEGFFSVSSSLACVDSVSVIIGDNGTGKTTIASVLGYLFQRGKSLPEYICIYKQAGRLVLYYHFEDGREAPDHSAIVADWVDAETDPKYADVLKHDSPFDIVYYSPHFSTNEVWPGKVMADELRDVTIHRYDISTGHLIQHPKISDGNVDKILAYRFEEQKRILHFAHKHVNAIVHNGSLHASEYYKSGPILPPPLYAQLLVKPTALTELELSDYCNSTKDNAEQEYWREAIRSSSAANPAWKLVSEMVARVSQAKDVGDRQDVVALQQVLIDICREARKISDHMSDEQRFDVFLRYLSGIDVVRAGGEIIGILKKVLKAITRLYRNSSFKQSKGSYVLEGQVDISSINNYDDIIDVRKDMVLLEMLFGKTIGRQGPLMDVELANMSSGEMAYWTLFARLDDALQLMTENGDARDILLFLDEAETTLHPEWQRQLVRNVILFLEKYVSGRHVHIIFATHSPMILSDVPKGNVVFLGKDMMARKGEPDNCVGNKQMTLDGLVNTFGANIFELHRLAFNQSNGTTGEFATNIIQDALSKVAEVVTSRVKCSSTNNASKALDEDTKQVLSQIGDPLIRKYLEGLKAGGLI